MLANVTSIASQTCGIASLTLIRVEKSFSNSAQVKLKVHQVWLVQHKFDLQVKLAHQFFPSFRTWVFLYIIVLTKFFPIFAEVSLIQVKLLALLHCQFFPDSESGNFGDNTLSDDI